MIAALGLAALLVLAGDPGSAARGRQIYERGKAADGAPVLADLGGGTEAIDASLVPCTTCHGDDGRGRAEGGVKPADLRPATLAHPLTEPPRTRPAYTEATLLRAIAMGIDAGGVALDRSMPRFQLSQAQMRDLLSYLAVLGRDEPGVSDAVILLRLDGLPDLTLPTAPVYGRRLQRQDDAEGSAFATLRRERDGRITVVLGDAEQRCAAAPRFLGVTPPPSAPPLAPYDPYATAARACVDEVVEALRQVGRDVTRKAVLAALRKPAGS